MGLNEPKNKPTFFILYAANLREFQSKQKNVVQFSLLLPYCKNSKNKLKIAI